MKHPLLLITFFIATASFAQTDTTAKEEVLMLSEIMPVFPGGEGEMMKFIQQNISYPMAEARAGISGTCFTTFVVEKDGSISNIKLLRGVKNGPGLDKEALRVVSVMPKWNPGKQNGKEVSVQLNLPIKFTMIVYSEPTVSSPAEIKKTNLSNTYYNKGVAFAKSGEYEKAIEQFDLVLTIFPKDEEALYNKGFMNYKLNKMDQACQIWSGLRSLGSSLADDMLKKTCQDSITNKSIMLIENDTAFYNSLGASSRRDASRYRFAAKQEGNYLVKELDAKNGNVTEAIECSSIAPIVRNGKSTLYRENGSKIIEGNYTNDKRTGDWMIWENEKEDSLVVEYFNDGMYKNKFVPPHHKDNIEMNVLYKVEEMPVFVGGEPQRMAFFQNNMKYPISERDRGIQGTCYISFVIEKDGSLTDIKVLKGVKGGGGLDAEALRVAKLMPNWTPGKQYGTSVRVQFNLPVKFTIR